MLEYKDGVICYNGEIFCVPEDLTGWELQSYVYDFARAKKYNGCVIPFDCEGGCINQNNCMLWEG